MAETPFRTMARGSWERYIVTSHEMPRFLAELEQCFPGLNAIMRFHYKTYSERHRTFVDKILIPLLWSCTLPVFPLGGLLGSLTVGLPVDRCSR